MTSATAVAIAVLVVVVVVVVLVLSARGTGTGEDLLDWDPSERIRRWEESAQREIEIGLAEHNRARARHGLPPQEDWEMLRDLDADRL